MNIVPAIILFGLLVKSCASPSDMEQQLADILPNFTRAASTEICVYNDCDQNIAGRTTIFYRVGGIFEGTEFVVPDYNQQTCKTVQKGQTYDMHFDGGIYGDFRAGNTALIYFAQGSIRSACLAQRLMPARTGPQVGGGG